jgi:signal transduction histidine kinase
MTMKTPPGKLHGMAGFGWVRSPMSRLSVLGRGSLLLQFSVLSLTLLALIAVSLGWVIQREMENGALEQQTNEVAAILQGSLNGQLTPTDLRANQSAQQRAHWDSLARNMLMADSHLVRIKVWNTEGRVVYSNNAQQIGRRFPIDDNLRAALDGNRTMDVSNLTQSENSGDRQGHSSLLEAYIPIYQGGGSQHVIGAYEAYSDLSQLQHELDGARRSLWGTVAVGFIVLYGSLFAIVRGASRRLVRQMHEIAILGVQAREAEMLREVDRLKDEFIGNVSHELRRPLASIKGYTASLLIPESALSPQVQTEFLQVIDEESDHLGRLIDNLLDLARLGSGSLRLLVEPVHLPTVSEHVVRRVRAQAQLPPHPYELDFPDHFPSVEADRERVMQVLLNLLENAAKYSPASGPIVVKGGVSAEAVTIGVRDQGPGLTADQAARVFDKFYRVDSGLTRVTEGTGLGLAICRGIIDAHGGRIWVETSPGAGCTFMVQLPFTHTERDVRERST